MEIYLDDVVDWQVWIAQFRELLACTQPALCAYAFSVPAVDFTSLLAVLLHTSPTTGTYPFRGMVQLFPSNCVLANRV